MRERNRVHLYSALYGGVGSGTVGLLLLILDRRIALAISLLLICVLVSIVVAKKRAGRW